MGNKRSRAARLSGGGDDASSRWRRRLEIARQEHAARQMLAATNGRPAASTRKLRALGALMLGACLLLGSLGGLLVGLAMRHHP